MSDEIYEFLISKGHEHISLSSIAPDLKDRIFIVNGFAKAWAMTGWRIGYLVAKTKIINKAIALQSQSTSNVCSFVQRGALEAVRKAPKGIKHMIESYDTRRTMLTEKIKEIEQLTLTSPNGAFYAFPLLDKKLPGSIEFCKIALEKEGLALIPGVAFGEDRCIRISCSVSEETINEGIIRLKAIINKII